MYTTRKRERRRPIRRGPFGHGSQRQLRWYTCDVPRSAASHSNDIERERGSSSSSRRRRRISTGKKKRELGGANTICTAYYMHVCYTIYFTLAVFALLRLASLTWQERGEHTRHSTEREEEKSRQIVRRNKTKQKKIEETTLLLAYIDENLTVRKCVSCWASKHSVLFACRRHSERIQIKKNQQQ